MIFLRSLLFNLCFAGWGIIAPVLLLPLAIPSSALALTAGSIWANGALWLLEHICGIRQEIRGSRYIAQGPVIYACKHQSAWDTVALMAMIERPAYVLKRSLILIPFWGWYLGRMKMIAIDRSKGMASIRQINRQSKEALAEGRQVIIYPEGTRTAPGAPPHYRSGITALYVALDTPVVPIALNSGLCWGRNAFIKRPGTIVMEFLPPIPPGLEKDAFMARLQSDIETASQRLLKEATSTR